MGGLAHPQVLETIISVIGKPKPRLFRHREIFHGLKVEGLSAEQEGRLIKRQCAIELVRGTVNRAEKVGFVLFGEVVCHVQVLRQVVRIIAVLLTGMFSTRDFHFPFLL